ncbi:nucleoside hydrolase [Sinirhodobacter populi]|uniref:Nucleoside hydrolase n=1 Tax=Paenirhodobacter populi TaxID=2306993 RepID=A0A443KD74_9RHOB|nr:nucleoside hydrolase [Sinirhodobacter populi]RWR30738.1 nucleoside hydrolase [Sinirhodobacter populi]
MGVWIDTDMGFDDIAAIMVVMRSGLPIDGISLVFGNAPLAQVRRNAAGAARAFGWRFPVHAGRASPVMGRLETAQAILGESGIPTRGRSLPDAGDPPVSDAFTALCRWLEETPSPRRILALGPLGNLAALALARPDLAARVDELVWMGGGLTQGNHTASAEFNAFADPEALAIVLAQGLPLRMVDLDFCRRILAGPETVAPIAGAGGANAALLADLFGGFIDIALSRGRPAMALYDPAAAVAFARPDLVTWQPARIDIECAGQLTRGRTVVETRTGRAPFNAHFAAGCDADAVRQVILDALIAEAAR